MFFRRKTTESHAKSVQNIRKLLFSLGKTKEKQKTCFFVGKPRKITPNPSKTLGNCCFPRENQGKAKKKIPNKKKKTQKNRPSL